MTTKCGCQISAGLRTTRRSSSSSSPPSLINRRFPVGQTKSTFSEGLWRQTISITQKKLGQEDTAGDIVGVGCSENQNGVSAVTVVEASRESCSMTATLSMSFTNDICSSGEGTPGVLGAYK